MQEKKRNFKPLLIVGTASLYLIIFLCACVLLIGVLLRACSMVEAPEKPKPEQQTAIDTEHTTEDLITESEQTTQTPVPVPPDDWYGYEYGLETVIEDSYLQTITFCAERFCLPYDSEIASIDGTVQHGRITLNGQRYDDIAHNVEMLAQFSDDFLQFYADSPAELSIIQRIQRTKACSVIRNPYAEGTWEQIAIYRIENSYYFVFFDQSGTVERIHSAEIRYTKVDEIYESGLGKHLMIGIEDYMEEQSAFIYPEPTSFAIKLYQIKQYGLQPMLVKFNAKDYYYACAYYTPTHTHPEIEAFQFCCKDQYVWVRYENPEQIAQSHNGMEFLCAFQVNRTLFCEDIGVKAGLSKDLANFHRYTPVFENGFNTATAIPFDQCFIYINVSNHETAYHSTDLFDHEHMIFDCVELDGQYYVPIHLYTVDADQIRRDNNLLEEELGSYHDRVMKVMIADKYSVYVSQTGSTKYYGLIPLEDMQDMISE